MTWRCANNHNLPHFTTYHTLGSHSTTRLLQKQERPQEASFRRPQKRLKRNIMQMYEGAEATRMAANAIAARG